MRSARSAIARLGLAVGTMALVTIPPPEAAGRGAFLPESGLLSPTARSVVAQAGASAGRIRGLVTIGEFRPEGTVKVNVDQAICGLTQPDQSIVTSATGGVAHAVVSIGARVSRPKADTAVTNQHCRFVPHVQVARSGTTLRIGSEDKTLHTTHAYAEDGRTLFNVAIPIPGITINRPLERPGVIRLACDTHPWMRGFVVVTDELAAVTDRDGRFTIADVPAGTYHLHVWHETLRGGSQKVTVAAGGEAEVTFQLSQ